MDSNFTIKPRAGVQKAFGPRDPVPVREAVETDLDAGKTLTATGDGGAPQRDPRHDARQQRQEPGQDLRQDHPPHDVVADPESRDVIYRENDVRTHANDPIHPDQALLRLRAYRPTRSDGEGGGNGEPHANIKA
jgi:hypothetical protein